MLIIIGASRSGCADGIFRQAPESTRYPPLGRAICWPDRGQQMARVTLRSGQSDPIAANRVRVILAARWRSFTTSSSSTHVGSGTHASSSLCEYSTYLVFLCHSSWTHHDSNLKLKLVFPIQDTLPTSSVEITQCLVCPPATAYHQEPLGTQVSHPYIILLTPDSRHPSSQCLLSPPASKKTMHYKMHSDFVSLGHNWRKITQNTASYAISNSIFRKFKVNSGFFNSHLPLCCV